MSLDTENLEIDEWVPDIYKGTTFKFQMVVQVNGVAGYEANDTFEGFASLEPEATVGEALAFTLDNPSTGLLTIKLTKVQSAALELNGNANAAIYLGVKWNRTTPADTKKILAIRPILHAEEKV